MSNAQAQKYLDRQKRGGYLLPVIKRTPKMKRWARWIADGVRNVGFFEELHSGITPSTKTGDWSDVYVVTPYGNIPWVPAECTTMVGGQMKTGVYAVSRISDKEMHELMLKFESAIEFGLRTYEANKDVKFVNQVVQRSIFGFSGVSWDRNDFKK